MKLHIAIYMELSMYTEVVHQTVSPDHTPQFPDHPSILSHPLLPDHPSILSHPLLPFASFCFYMFFCFIFLFYFLNEQSNEQQHQQAGVTQPALAATKAALMLQRPSSICSRSNEQQHQQGRNTSASHCIPFRAGMYIYVCLSFSPTPQYHAASKSHVLAEPLGMHEPLMHGALDSATAKAAKHESPWKELPTKSITCRWVNWRSRLPGGESYP